MGNGNPKKLTPEQIEEAKRLREQGYSKRKLAVYFEVTPTLIWNNVYRTHTVKRKKYIAVERYSVRRIDIIHKALQVLKTQGYTSKQAADMLYLDLKDVNYLYPKIMV